jgi:hypothetical protein
MPRQPRSFVEIRRLWHSIKKTAGITSKEMYKDTNDKHTSTSFNPSDEAIMGNPYVKIAVVMKLCWGGCAGICGPVYNKSKLWGIK